MLALANLSGVLGTAVRKDTNSPLRLLVGAKDVGILGDLLDRELAPWATLSRASKGENKHILHENSRRMADIAD
jgi:hypothetical protein